MRTNLHNSNLRGMTLLEVLVSITILSILFTFAFSGYSIAIATGKRGKCIANLRQSSASWTCHVLDDNFLLPPFYHIVKQGDGSGVHYKIFTEPPWATSDILTVLQPASLVCPADTHPSTMKVKNANGNTLTTPCSYGYNFIPFVNGIRVMDLDQSRTYLLFDGTTEKLQQGVWQGDLTDIDRFNTDIAVKRHSRNINVLFMDGHCEVLTSLSNNGLMP